jgi:hypothetical protein
VFAGRRLRGRREGRYAAVLLESVVQYGFMRRRGM